MFVRKADLQAYWLGYKHMADYQACGTTHISHAAM
jgi:hypothetical protein